MDYVYQNSYFNYLLEADLETERMNSYIQECVILSEGKNVNLKLLSLNEDVGDKIRNGWDKFIAFIKRIWAKFTESITRMMNTDVGYLEKYKDIILGKKLKEVSITMRPYNIGLQRLTQSIVPVFSTNLLATINPKDDTDIKFKKTLIHTYDGKTEFPSFAKEYFLGGEEQEFTEHSINMTDLYNFCKDKKKIMSNLEKDQKTITDAANASQTLLTGKLNEIKTKQQQPAAGATVNNNGQGGAAPTSGGATPPTTSKIVKSNNAQETITDFEYNGKKYTIPSGKKLVDKGNGTVVVESAIAYSRVYNTVLNELEFNKPGNGNSSAASSANSNTASQASGTSSVKANTTNNVDKDHDTNNQATQDTKLAQEEVATLESKIAIYRNDCSTILTAKMTAVEAIYRDYMKIIKKHVSDYVGTDKSGDNTSAKTGSDYTNNRIKELDQATKAKVLELVKAAEAEQDETAKLDKQKEAIQAVRTHDGNFKGGYEQVKSLVDYQAQS